MKKIALSLAGLMAAVAFAPEASAVPVFARQTGMACSACHYQHFPLLNGFGRAFKSAGFTMMGAQGKVEGEHLDIPDRLNMAVLSSAYVQNESGSMGANGGRLGVPASGGELSLFYGGRVSEFAGFLSELGAAGTAGAAGTGAAKLAMLFPVGDARVGLVAYTGGQGAAYGFELLNTGASDTHKMMGNSGVSKEHIAAAYAASYMGARTDATGATIVANNSMGFVSVGKFAAAGPGTGSANTLPLTYIRAAGTFDLAGWDSAIGIQSFNGDQTTLAGFTADKSVYKLTVVDAQFQGEVAGLGLGVYVTVANAPADVNGNNMAAGWSTLRKANAVATAVNKASSVNVAASLEVIPHIATVQAAMRQAKNGGTTGKDGDNAMMIGATYELAQNIEIGLNYTTQSGTAWDEIKTATGKEGVGKTASTLLLEVLF